MKPAQYDFEIQQGSTIVRQFELSETTIDLTTDYDGVRMMIRPKPESENIVWDSTTSPDGGITIVGATTIELTIQANETAKFSYKKCGYDVELYKTNVPELVDKLITGTISVVREYTREDNS